MHTLQSEVTRTNIAPAWPGLSARWPAVIVALSLLCLRSPDARAQARPNNDYVFVNAVDSTTQGFSSFGFAPAINNNGAVAFEAAGPAFRFGSVWKWQDGALTPIATNDNLRNFGDNVVLNASGTVGFSSRMTNNSDSIIATSDGGPLNIIASANDDGLVGGGFLAISALNDAGTAVFFGFRQGTFAQAIF